MSNYQLLLEIMSRKPPEDPWLEEVECMKDQSVDSLRQAFEKRLYSKRDGCYRKIFLEETNNKRTRPPKSIF